MTVAGFGSKQKNEKWQVAEAYIFVADAINSNRQNPSSTLFPSRYLSQEAHVQYRNNECEFQRGSRELVGHHTLSRYNDFPPLYGKQLNVAMVSNQKLCLR
jgi:hypothetical protein